MYLSDLKVFKYIYLPKHYARRYLVEGLLIQHVCILITNNIYTVNLFLIFNVVQYDMRISRWFWIYGVQCVLRISFSSMKKRKHLRHPKKIDPNLTFSYYIIVPIYIIHSCR